MAIKVSLLEPNIFMMRYEGAVGLDEYTAAYAEMRTQGEVAGFDGPVAHIADLTDCTLIFDDLLGSIDTFRTYREVRVYAIINPPRTLRLIADVLLRMMPTLSIRIVPDVDMGLVYCREILATIDKSKS